MDKKKQSLPASAIGLYISAGIMAILFIMSVVGIAIGGEDGSRVFFIMAALITAAMVITCALIGQWLAQKDAAKKKSFASYAFEGDFAPQKKTVYTPKKDSANKKDSGNKKK